MPGGQIDQQRLADWMETESRKKMALSPSQGHCGQMPVLRQRQTWLAVSERLNSFYNVALLPRNIVC